jgi:hypothetical protein
MDIKTFLLFKTCKFEQTSLIFGLLSLFQKIFFLKTQNGRKIQYGRFFAKKIMTLNEI